MVLQKFYKTYYRVPLQQPNPYKCRSIGDMNILLHSLKQCRRDLEKKQHAKETKNNPGTTEAPAFQHWPTVQNKLLVQVARGFWNQDAGTYCTIMWTDKQKPWINIKPHQAACTHSTGIQGGRESNADILHCSQIKQEERKIPQAGNCKLHSQTNCIKGNYI